MKKIFTLLFAFCFYLTAHAQITFQKVIDTLGSSGAFCVKETFDGGFIVTGGSVYNSNDATLIKLDSAGNIEWAQLYTGGGADGGRSVEQLPDSGYIMDGGYAVGLYSKHWLLRLDKNGDTLWTKTYSVDSGSTDAYQLAVNTKGNFGMTGYFSSPVIQNDAYLIITDSNGAVLNSNLYTSPFGSEAYSICKTANNGFVLTGDYGIAPSTGVAGFFNIDSIGDTINTKHYNFSNTRIGWGVVLTNDSGFAITGISWNNIDFKYNAFLIKTDSMGDTLFTRFYNNTVTVEAYSLDQTSDGGYIIAGTIVNGTPINRDVYLMRTGANGDTLWTREFGGSGPDNGLFVRQTKDGGFIICGLTSQGTGGTYLIKTDSMGHVNSNNGIVEVNNPFIFNIYPNPATGVFSTEVNGLPNNKAHLEIYNTNNQCIYQCMINNRITEHIDLSTNNNGVYMVMLRTKDNLISKKIIIQK